MATTEYTDSASSVQVTRDNSYELPIIASAAFRRAATSLMGHKPTFASLRTDRFAIRAYAVCAACRPVSSRCPTHLLTLSQMGSKNRVAAYRV